MSDIAFFSHAGATLVAETTVGAAPETESPVFVLIHGIGMGRTVFADLITRLHARTIAIDLPGYGEAPEPRSVLTMERTADLVAAYLHSIDAGRIVLVGHSMGSQVAGEVAARHPELVDRVVFIGPTVDARQRTAVRQLLRLAQDLAVESPRVIVVGAREYLRAGPNLRGKLRAMLAHRPERTYSLVRAPVLVLRGENDYVSSRDWCRIVVASLRQGRLAEVPGHGHETMIRDAAPAAELIAEFAREG
ncbi:MULTISPECIES: alpha/beta hydrolase [unclassified Microbacterium]|uniref:alpha/beta fold hydrolase n=1 Tax=unclassified Microbacterium TaxID=2609290 RepID=UPI00214C42E9|nr:MULTISPECIES: alpha/beta hydrolase [unclassified Microbacterium]MCR2810865.1 alpha/beta fold hydrolase [Microbacterium sp. zg.B185]WIM19731.1 alpha/beta hydrolase [Microbacterium sp. zg-B185]